MVASSRSANGGEDGREPNQGLLQRLQSGDDAAFEIMVRHHLPRMRAVIVRITGDGDADDVVQNAFVSAFKALPGFRGEANLGTWLHRIAVNAALMHLRRRKPARQLPIDDLLPTFSDEGHRYDELPVAWAESAEILASRQETRAWVRDVIEQLPAAYREVLLLRDIEELSTQETAELLDVTTNVVKTRLHRARQALRTLMERALEKGVS